MFKSHLSSFHFSFDKIIASKTSSTNFVIHVGIFFHWGGGGGIDNVYLNVSVELLVYSTSHKPHPHHFFELKNNKQHQKIHYNMVWRETGHIHVYTHIQPLSRILSSEN